ncbi:MAG TPA: peptide chain release factor N(5)-glutamine methyltransferase [Candidatus Acidoferrum sp.]|nr:peptide chain release factor N(5)-glutamine methyltransferase [Candidatus Acidoferrum sp.]
MERTLDIRTALKRGIAELRDANVPSYTLAAELLLLHVLGRDRAWLYAHPEETVSALDAHRFISLIARRAEGEPTQHLTGKQDFWGLEFEVTPDVLIPRPETEHLMEVALDRLAVREKRTGLKQTLAGDGLQVIDVGTGSGCIAITLAKELPGARIIATDISAAALAVARRNATRHAVADRIQFLESNLLDALCVGARYIVARQSNVANNSENESPVTSHESRSFDLIVSNPPYIGRSEKETLQREVRDHEPELALYGGEEGYELYAELIAQAARHLKPGGLLVLELGHNSLPAVQPLLDLPNWTNAAVTNDLAGIPRVIAAERS